MAPLLKGEGTTFYGAVEFQPREAEDLTRRSRTLKLVVGLAVVAVALTAGVFAFTSPADGSALAVDNMKKEVCGCDLYCGDKEGYNNFGTCKMNDGHEGCVDVERQAPSKEKCLDLKAGVAHTYKPGDKCGTCHIIAGKNACKDNPCKNSGTCFDGQNRPGADPRPFFCKCKFGYYGPTCSKSAEFCGTEETKFCSNGAKDTPCNDNTDCEGVYLPEEDKNSECTVKSTNVCHSDATCTKVLQDTNYEYKCECKNGYSGDGYALNQETVRFGSLAPWVTQWSDLKRKQFDVQNRGATGGCQDIDDCKDRPCGDNGNTCEDTGAYTFKCTCKDGWKGATCRVDINECEEGTPCGDPRKGATCHNIEYGQLEYPDDPFGYKCKCGATWIRKDGYDVNEKWQGCDDLNDCVSNKKLCLHGSTCREGKPGSALWTCECAQGWEGIYCGQDTDECKEEPNGCDGLDEMSCVNTLTSADPDEGNADGYYCECNEFYEWYVKPTDVRIPLPLDASKNAQKRSVNKCVDIDDCKDDQGNESNSCKPAGTMSCEHLAWRSTNPGSPPTNEVEENRDYKCNCNEGYKGDNCDEDVDECLTVTHITKDPLSGETVKHNARDIYCLEDNGRCENTYGSYTCTCKAGYMGDGIHFCNDIDDCKQAATTYCASTMDSCAVDSDCLGMCMHKSTASCSEKGLATKGLCIAAGVCTMNDDGSASLEKEGSEADCDSASDAVDKTWVLNVWTDEIKTMTTTGCTIVKDCDTEWAAKATFAGLGGDGWTCEGTYGVCVDSEKVPNQYPTREVYQEGSAAPMILSPAPWVLQKQSDEKIGVHKCGTVSNEGTFTARGSCTDTGADSYLCLCNEGWEDSHCDRDTDECASGTHECDSHSSCENTPGSYECTCDDGHADAHTECEPESKVVDAVRPTYCGRRCHDVDDCIESRLVDPKCKHGQCKDVGVDAFECQCNEGWEDFHCDADTNECGTTLGIEACGAHASCKNTKGSFACDCHEGYVKSTENSLACPIEVDDCAASPCEHGACNNVKGVKNAYNCKCDEGWTDKKCDFDVNECRVGATEQHGCDLKGRCVNTPGSYFCRCISGYEGDGYTCTDLDDCDPDPCGSCAGSQYADLSGVYYPQEGSNPTFIGPFSSDRFTCPVWSVAENKNVQPPTGCTDKGANSYECACCVGWKGDNCCEPVDPCDDAGKTCGDNAGCTNDLLKGAKCECKDGFFDECREVKLDDGKIVFEDPQGEGCFPGKNCQKCIVCEEMGPENEDPDDLSKVPDGVVYSCSGESNPPFKDPGTGHTHRKYYPWDLRYNNADPAVFYTGGRGFKDGSMDASDDTTPLKSGGKYVEATVPGMCKYSQKQCVNINECDAGGEHTCSKDEYCKDECGSFRCECNGADATGQDTCNFGTGKRGIGCEPCTECKEGEYMAREATTTTDRLCLPLISDGLYAIETHAGGTSQCLVKWAEAQKVFPERYNWGGAAAATGTGKEAADLCGNGEVPICGVCNWGGETAKANIKKGLKASWMFRRLDKSADYLILSNADGQGYRCLGFRSEGAPYPELVRWDGKKWTNKAYKNPSQVSKADWEMCGMQTVAKLKSNGAVVWNVKALGCSNEDFCATRTSDLFLLRSKKDASSKCLHFKDHDSSRYSHPERDSEETGPWCDIAGIDPTIPAADYANEAAYEAKYEEPKGICATTFGTSCEAALIEKKAAVFKLISLS